MSVVDHAVIAARKEKIANAIARSKRMVWVTFQREGVHADKRMATAEGDDEFDVEFLANDHRHVFHYEVGFTDFNANQIQFKRWCELLFTNKVLTSDGKSCAELADELFYQISLHFPDQSVTIKVSEDGENGVTINY